MHKYLNTFGFAGVAMALAATPALVSAQDQAMPDTASQPEAEMQAPAPAPIPAAPPTEEQLLQVAAWPADQQEAYKAWKPEVQNYFWSLTAERQTMFWRLNDSDRETLTKLTDTQREMAWGQIKSKLGTMQS